MAALGGLATRGRENLADLLAMVEEWELLPAHQAMACADLVVINAGVGDDRVAAERTRREIERILADPDRAFAIIGPGNRRVRVRVADLADPRHPETKRIVRAVKRRFPPSV